MLCDHCHEREANVKYTQIINGQKKEMNLCEKCSQELGIGNMQFNMPLSFSNFFEDFFEPELNFMPSLALPKQEKCDTCGMTYDEFTKIGKFGCANCYETFSNRIDPILKRLQGANRYTGKRKEKTSIIKLEKTEIHPEENKLEQLQSQLKKAIQEEKYEEAAKIRDEIKKLEKKGGKENA